MKPDVELHIEELVLHGFRTGDRYRIGNAVEREVARLIAEQGAPSSPARSRAIQRGSFVVTPGSGPETIGVEVARTVYEGLGT